MGDPLWDTTGGILTRVTHVHYPQRCPQWGTNPNVTQGEVSLFSQ